MCEGVDMKVWIEEAVKANNWQTIADDDTGDASPELQAAARLIIELEGRLQDAYYEAMGEDL